jgi:protein-tyrosine-phosphatase
MLRILIVCTGNTCRSPMAEALLKQKVKETEYSDRILVLSAGIFAGGDPASPEACRAMAARGLVLEEHTSRQLSPQFVQAANLILTMTDSHKRKVLSMVPAAADKTFILTEFAGERGDVGDPFGGSAAMYEACARQIQTLLDKSWEKIVKMAGDIN